MKITCDSKTVRDAAFSVGRVVNPKSPHIPYHHVKLVAGDDGAALMATDGEVKLRHSLDGCVIEEPGEVLLPYERTAEILRLAVERGGGPLHIHGGRRAVDYRENQNHYRLNTLVPEKIEYVAVENSEVCQTVKAGLLRLMIRRTLFATDDVSLDASTGVLLDFTTNAANWPVLAMVALDGRRLAVQQALAETEKNGPSVPSPVIPAKTLKLLASALQGDDLDVRISFPNDRSVQFQAGGMTMRSALLAGKFPPYRKFLDKMPAVEDRVRVGFPASVLSDTIKEVLAGYPKDAPTKLLKLTLEMGALHVETIPLAKSKEGASVSIDADHFGSPQTVYINPAYALDALKTFAKGEVVQTDFLGARKPLLISVPDYQYVLMPVNPEG